MTCPVGVQCLCLINRPFYSCVLSYLAYDCKQGWRWPCFDTDLSAFIIDTISPLDHQTLLALVNKTWFFTCPAYIRRLCPKRSIFFELTHLITVSFNLMIPMLPITALNEPWPFFTSDVITFEQNWQEQEKKTFPMIPRSKWLTQWNLNYTQKCSEIGVKNSEQNFLPLHMTTPWQKLPVSMMLSWNF